MELLKVIIEGCIEILNTRIGLFEYSISLAGVFIYGSVGTLLLFFLFKVFR